MKWKLILLSICITSTLVIQSQQKIDSSKLAPTPPLGWNSFDCYGVYLYEEAASANLKVLAEKYKPFGYEYFVIDNGWFGEYKLHPGTHFAMERHASDIHIDEYGLVQPSKTYFPNGLKALIDDCHKRGLKFGIHLMRGIPRKAVEQNTPIKGSIYHAQDIADTIHVCTWCNYNYGVDMSKPGSQEFYNSLINQLASWGIDFIKADDIVPYPLEVKALTDAIAQCRRPILLSLSPGDHVREDDLHLLRTGNMLRVTADIWDTQQGINSCFDAWKKWQGKERPDFWIDMDMIPFGQLQLMSPPASDDKSTNTILLSGRGNTRKSELTKPQMRTFITLRALAASPLMIGGDLPTMDDYSYSLITNPTILAANQNGIMGHLVHQQDGIEVWKTPQKGKKSGWLGIFNRTDKPITRKFSKQNMGIDTAKNYKAKEVWNQNKNVILENEFAIGANDVVFLYYY